MQDRRHFLKTGFSFAAAGLAGAAALTGARRSLAEEAPPETTSVRLLTRTTRLALRRLTSSTISCVTRASPTSAMCRRYRTPIRESVARGDVDFGQDFSASAIISIDAGVPAVMLAGVHPACFELFARESIRSVVDLKGKNVGVIGTTDGNGDYVMLSIIAASVGLDPAKDINWVAFGAGDPKGPFRRRARSTRS